MKRIGYLSVIWTIILLWGCSSKYPVAESLSSSQVVSEENTLEPTQEPVKEPVKKPAGSIEESVDAGVKSEATFFIASDIHYLADSLTDRGSRFTQMVEHGDGKVVQYIDQILEAFLDEVISGKPDALILSGDLTLNGERASHDEFVHKLGRVKDRGIPILIIPGNHDINNQAAAQFKDNVSFPAAHISADEFVNIYQDFGYNQAYARDPNSLSYVYQINDNTRFLMLDSCQYDPVNRIGGMIKTETYEWIEAQLEEAWEQSMTVIPISHHNLLDESEVYVEDCTIEHSEALIGLLEGWDIPIYLSGHLHVQHSKQSRGDEGIYEIVTSSLATPPCQYGILELMEYNTYRYRTQAVDVSGWAVRNNIENEELLQFDSFKEPFLSRVFYNQAQDKMKDRQIPEEIKDRMAKLYAKLNTYYYAGEAVRVKRSTTASPMYKRWEEYMYDDILLQYIQSIVADANRDYNSAVIE